MSEIQLCLRKAEENTPLGVNISPSYVKAPTLFSPQANNNKVVDPITDIILMACENRWIQAAAKISKPIIWPKDSKERPKRVYRWFEPYPLHTALKTRMYKMEFGVNIPDKTGGPRQRNKKEEKIVHSQTISSWKLAFFYIGHRLT